MTVIVFTVVDLIRVNEFILHFIDYENLKNS